MAHRWRGLAPIALGLVGLTLTAGCGSKRVAPAQPPAAAAAPPTRIALLPDPETRVTGRIRVSNEFGSIDVSTPRASLRVISTAAPGPIATMSEDDVTKWFGEAMAALPPAPKHFTLRFKFESDNLTDESAALVPVILQAVKALRVPEVMIVGHTDTMGDKKLNVSLGMRRAVRVRGILAEAGLALDAVEVTSHGEADPVVKTKDNTPEPRNRRVEITVR